MNRIRPLAICVFRYGDHILVAEGYDLVKQEYFYRPLGGGIEFGENSAETISREIREELNIEIDGGSLKYLGALENIFHFNGSMGHEIVMVYDGTLKEPSLYQQKMITGQEANGEDIRAMWKNIDEFGEGKSILYPTGLLEILR
jgi:8-oxo-dGTP pyrophosphatase MutT (NUDIX family)